jgi:Ala-tRNA(Pro) deacylase
MAHRGGGNSAIVHWAARVFSIEGVEKMRLGDRRMRGTRGMAGAFFHGKSRVPLVPGAGGTMQACSTRLEQYLRLYRVPYSLVRHAPTFRSQMTAAALHVPGKRLAKTVVLEGKAQCYLAVLPASYHVDLGRVAGVAGEPLHLASEEKFHELFPDCELGAIPPFGRLYGVPVFLDVTLAVGEEIVFPAGSHGDALRMSYADFEELARPEVCSFAIKDAAAHAAPHPARKREKGREHA